MGTQGDPAVGACIQAFLNAISNNDDWLLRFIKNKQDAVDGWFAENPCTSPDTTQAAKDIIMQGNFDGAKLHLAAIPPPERGSDAWLTVVPTIWLV